jgi:Tol biopolymer transport system component
MDGGRVRRLFDLRDNIPAGHEVSPDRRRLAISRGWRDPAVLIVEIGTGRIDRTLESYNLVEWLSDDRIAISRYDEESDSSGTGVVNAATGELEAFVPGVESSSAAWSPDGSLLVWAPPPHIEEGGLWLITPSTGERRRIAPGPHAAPAWTAGSGDLVVYGWRESDAANGFKRYRRDGDDLVLVSFDEAPREEAGAALSPDGSQWARVRVDASGAQAFPKVYVDRVAVEDPPRLVATGGQPAWSPDGRSLAYVRDGELWMVDVPSGQEHSLVQPALPVIALPTWIDGETLLFAALGGGSGVYIADPDGSNERYVIQGSDPVLSPDGSRIAFFYGGCGLGCEGKYYVMDRDATDIRPLARSYSGDVAPICRQATRVAWAPNGNYIAVTSGFTGSETITVVPLDGSIHAPQHGPPAASPSWSADSARVAYVASRADPLQPCEVRIANATGLRIEARFAARGSPLWSPDGRLVAVATNDGIAYFDPRNPDSWSLVGAGSIFAWSPDSRKIAFRGTDGALIVTDIYSGESFTVLSETRFSALGWIPDGRIWYSYGDPPQVWAVQAAAGATPSALLQGWSLSFTPDGSAIVFGR